MTKGKITKSMLDNLDYDTKDNKLNTKMENVSMGESSTIKPTAMFVFAKGDINAAAYHLIQSMKSPFAADSIASVFVEEAILERFKATLRPQLPKYDETVTGNAAFKLAMETAARLNAKTIYEEPNRSSGATLICDFTHEHLSSSGTSGVVTLHAFRTVKEAIALCGKETIVFENVTIWNENHSCAYELVAALRSKNFFINCHKVSMEPLKKSNVSGNYVAMDKSYHYETLCYEAGVHKNIVFPIGTIFAN